jgi:aminoglycoside/choline kinase family phosphotransferase
MPGADPALRPELADYLQRVYPGARVRSLPGDASSRRFHRVLARDGSTHIVMDYGRPLEAPTDDLHLNRIFRTAELPVAEIQKVSREAGCLVLEDLGDQQLEQALRQRSPDGRIELLRRAVALAADVHRLGSPVLAVSSRAAGPALDTERFVFEMEFFLEHFAGALRGSGQAASELRPLLHRLARRAARSPEPVFCHRDFHSRNLMLLSNGSLAMVDIQDARWGPDSYDLASLLRDAYIDLPEEAVLPLIEHYLDRLDEPPPLAGFRKRFDVVAAQRMLKALGTFGYQTAVRGSDRYRSAIARTLTRLRSLLPRCEETRELHGALDAAGLLDEAEVDGPESASDSNREPVEE